jgi:ABC-type bacteriocin/lantibiotic exporter with double-glycine peptidase domain
VVGIVASFIYGLILLLISWPLALVCFLLQSLQLAILLGSRADRNDRAIQLAQAEGQLFATTYDSLRTIETIKSSGIEDQIFRRWTGYHARYTNQLQKLTGTTYQVNSISRLVNDLLTATILLGGGYLVIRGQLSIGWLVSFRMIYDSFSQPLLSLAGSWSQLEQLIGDVGKLDDVEHESLDTFSSLKELAESKTNVVTEQATAHLSPTADEAHDDLPSQSHRAMALEIKALSFGYDNQEPATLSDLSLIIPAASRVAFVGETGCGKSTLLRVIAGLYTPRSGEVLYDGLSLQELTPGVLHARLAYVTQLSQVIEGTIQDNITLFDERYSEEDVIAAARSACIDADISLLPDGYLTNVGSAGFRFSGGQRQRINLARALIRAPGLLLMDEATSALDASTEELIVSNINQMNCTQIVVAHRLNTVVGCDQIYYFERGKIVESGTHQELLSLGGQYASQYQASKVGASR